MFRNNLRMMIRTMRKHPLHSAINIGGLAVGLSCFLVIALYVKHELSFDRMFERSGSIYRVTMSSMVGGQTNHIPTSYPALAPGISDRFASVGDVTRIYNYKYSRLDPTFRYGDRIHYEKRVIFADSTFFNLFDFSFVAGDPATALSHPNSVVITEQVARKYFGDENALGKVLRFNGRTDIAVTGVLRDLPSATHLQFDFLIPLSYYSQGGSKMLESWSMDWFWTYLAIPDPQQVSVVERGINELATEKIGDFQKENDVRFYLQALTDVHLRSAFDYNTDLVQNGDSTTLYILIAAGVIVLLISAINFVNLSIAVASGRYKEIGISKVLGAVRAQLRWQFLLESVGICVLALAIAFALLAAALPLFSALLDAPLTLDPSANAGLYGLVLLFTLGTGLLAGLFPALFVSAIDPQRVLKGIWKAGQGGANFRKTLVGVQIGISIFLIIGTVIIFEQLRFIREKPLGYNAEQVVMLTVRDTKLVKGFHSFKNALLAETSINNVSSVSEPIGREVQFMTFRVEGRDQTQFLKILNVTHDFIETMGLEIVQGRDFSRQVSTDSTSGFIINETAARSFGWTEPVGKAIDHDFRETSQGRVIGVVKDFNFEPLQKQVDPIVIWFGGPYWYVAVNIQRGKTSEALAAMEREWKKLEAEKPFSFQFLDQSIQQVYDREQRLGKVFLLFSVLSILSGMTGLFGLISFIVRQRLAEIGIRKVMGASVRSILYLLSKEYLALVALAFLVAAPVSWWILNQWLNDFAFRIDWKAVYFLAGLTATGLIVLATVWARAVRAARANPVDVLRSE